MNEITDSATPLRLPAPAGRNRHRRATQAALGLVATAALAAAGSGIAGAAVVDPDADGKLVVVDECVEGVGPRLTLVYTNATGPGVANFDTTVDGEAIQDVSVLPGAQVVVHVPVEEGTKPKVVVSANGGYSETITKGWINCWDMTKWLGIECTDDGPRIVVTGTNTGSLYDTLSIERNGQPWGAYGIEPGEGFDLVVPVTEDASYDVKVVPGHSGWSSITGYANCVEPEPEPEVTSEEPTTPPAPTTTPAPTATVPPAEVQSVTLVAAPVAVAPNFTG